ncbi:hypothetical protein KGF56_001076 [Candida oxycetoniae]|uniref:RRM domain-containing protein n=1 Tax=Candida oxycetoniae TaxID=497107 RepID=A0AAI9WZN0_9ASCO|nr:uncharacterized protein KGF56_001076 [Candida oxycetoniae]KAI3406234.2 hypothetical protein KGF56_001076 [Candida oxycetoniae]
MSIGPKQTIYLNNLNEKVSLTKLKANLEPLIHNFEPLDISLAKTLKLKGQAFITFRDVDLASKVVNELNGLQLLGKPVRATFAKTNSDKVVLDEAQLKEIKKIRHEKKIIKNKNIAKSKKKKKSIKDKSKRESTQAKDKNKKATDLSVWKNLPPNRILLLQNLDSNISKEILNEVFQDFSGFEIVRFVKPRNLAFVDFADDEMARGCLEHFDEPELKQKFGSESIFSYAKK